MSAIILSNLVNPLAYNVRGSLQWHSLECWLVCMCDGRYFVVAIAQMHFGGVLYVCMCVGGGEG